MNSSLDGDQEDFLAHLGFSAYTEGNAGGKRFVSEPIGESRPGSLSTNGLNSDGNATKEPQIKVQSREQIALANNMLRVFGTTRKDRRCRKCQGEAMQDPSCGEDICMSCGLVLESHVLCEGQEWRDFQQDGGEARAPKSRAGDALNPWMEDCTLGTTLLGASKRFILLNENITGLKSGDRALRTAFGNLRHVAEALNLRETALEHAKEITKELHDQNLLKGRNHAITGLAIIYLACRESNQPRTLKEIVSYDPSLREKEVGKAINRIKKTLSHRKFSNMDTSTQMIPRLGSKLGLALLLIEKAQSLLAQTRCSLTSSHRPTSLAAGAIYLACLEEWEISGKPIPITELCGLTGSSSGTIKGIAKTLRGFLQSSTPATT